MASLENLRQLEDWSGVFIVADGVDFDWRKAPLKRYESFDHFYKEELQATWGSGKTSRRPTENSWTARSTRRKVPAEIEANRAAMMKLAAEARTVEAFGTNQYTRAMV